MTCSAQKPIPVHWECPTTYSCTYPQSACLKRALIFTCFLLFVRKSCEPKDKSDSRCNQSSVFLPQQPCSPVGASRTSYSTSKFQQGKVSTETFRVISWSRIQLPFNSCQVCRQEAFSFVVLSGSLVVREKTSRTHVHVRSPSH